MEAVKSNGYNKYPDTLKPGVLQWWKLTERGARVVCYWIGLGYDYHRTENGDKPTATIPYKVM